MSQKKRTQAVTGCLLVQICVGIVYLWSTFKGSLIKTYGIENGWTTGAANQVASIMLFGFAAVVGLADGKYVKAIITLSLGIFISTIGIATIAATINAGGLGNLLFDGMRTMNNYKILWGAIFCAVIALLADGILKWIENRVEKKVGAAE